jgi:Cys-tRNA(Pro)/Cys-tRNA(Cys) deacylase
MSGKATPATSAVTAAGVPHQVHDLHPIDDRGGRPGVVVAERLGVPLDRVLKTLVVRAGDQLVVVVAPLPRELDLKAVATAAGSKRAVLADARSAERATGYVVGGISPFGQRRRIRTFVDSSALDHPTVFVNGGRRGVEIELAPADLVELCRAEVAAVVA